MRIGFWRMVRHTCWNTVRKAISISSTKVAAYIHQDSEMWKAYVSSQAFISTADTGIPIADANTVSNNSSLVRTKIGRAHV